MLKAQVATLTNSLSTLMSEKTKIESSYQAERKKMRVSRTAVVFVDL